MMRGVSWQAQETQAFTLWQQLAQFWPAPFAAEVTQPPGVLQAHAGLQNVSIWLACMPFTLMWRSTLRAGCGLMSCQKRAAVPLESPLLGETPTASWLLGSNLQRLTGGQSVSHCMLFRHRASAICRHGGHGK